ncbi:aspartyl protease family protein At5g10770-like [Macadamia integrifolia]|uniref:aspartyl protease family protein At5g10770-like n=1 Tax=Macadamia integrifolia TaxID=60698 RepID=UPI001C4F10C7|nr:aspartyl protease family protein At5g10770-like [Macadamia integrifolia]
MELVFLVVFSLLAIASSLEEDTSHKTCFKEFQGHQVHNLSNSGLHLPLHHVHGPCSHLASPSPLSFSDILDRDETRIEALNSRLTKNHKTKSSKSKLSGKLNPNSVSIPLRPGMPIGTGNYYSFIGLGTPSKYYAMVIDTGSSFTWLQCQPCSVYCHRQVGTTFDPKTSKTHHYLSCATTECDSLEVATLNAPSCSASNLCIYAASYGDSSFSVGYLSSDKLTLAPSQTVPGFVYGCGEDNEGLFGQSAGLVGLARNKLSMLGQLSTKYGYAFSYCLPTSGSVGSLSIGSFNPSMYTFTPMLTNSHDPTLYFLRLVGITVSGQLLQVPGSAYKTATIIDSGTVISRLPVTVYTALKGSIVKALSKYTRAPAYSLLDTCYKGTVASLGNAIPEVRLIYLRGAEMKLSAQNVMLDVDNGVSCLAFAGSSGASGIAIIGNRQQETFNVAYDVTNSRIGFAAGGCR